MTNEQIRKRFFEMQDEKYRDFSKNLTPGEENMIGVRMPNIKVLAKEIASGNYLGFLKEPLTFYHEERVLYGLVISHMKEDIKTVLSYFEKWLDCVDNWGVCDTVVMAMKMFKKEKNRKAVFDYIKIMLDSKKPFIIRAAIVALFCYFNDDEYCGITAAIFEKIKNEHFYVKMGLAWGMCEILIKHYDTGLLVLKNKTLNIWVHNKAIQKALESFRIDDKKKEELRKLKINK